MTVAIAAGGTGGHVLPALAVARALGGTDVVFIGTDRGPGADIVRRAGYRMVATPVRPLARGLRGALGPLSMLPATVVARRALRRERVRAVLGMGGYPSLPVVAAARLERIPAVIHEQNAVPGLANEMAARLTPHVAVSFPGTVFGRRPVRLVGVPIRAEIASLDRDAARAEALRAFGLDPARATILIFGGSIGALRIDRAAVGLAAVWRDRTDVQVLLAAGADQIGWVREALEPGALIVRCEPFIERIDLAYAAADVAVTRGGASTVFELAAAALPAVVVPYPHARRREQDANARWLADAGGAVVLADAACTGDRLAAACAELLADPERRAKMGAAALAVARPHAAHELAAWMLELAEAR